VGTSGDIGLAIAFVAGLISFLSPCVAPLVPGYLAMISGAGELDQRRPDQTTDWRLIRASAAFVFGFGLVFVALGASAATFGGLLDAHRTTLIQVSGAFMIVMGVVLLGVLRIGWLLRERRWHLEPRRFTASESVLLGMAFGFGWTPCFGPVLAVILAYASTGETVREGTLLLASYALGLGLPFLLIGFGVGRFTRLARALRRSGRALNPLAGLVLIGLGALFISDRFFYVSIATQRFYYTLVGG
jgi:cytochrome c-type biogenesis protein